ncbi:2253_t:CDS:2, partial [Racocetra persica]
KMCVKIWSPLLLDRNCVGNFNHNYVLLFMTDSVIGCFYLALVGWKPFLLSLEEPGVRWMPRPYMALPFYFGCNWPGFGGDVLMTYYLVSQTHCLNNIEGEKS